MFNSCTVYTDQVKYASYHQTLRGIWRSYTYQIIIVLYGGYLRRQLLYLFVVHSGGHRQVIHRHGPEGYKESGTTTDRPPHNQNRQIISQSE